MGVDEFVTSTLVQITKGVAGAVSAVRDAGGIVNPAGDRLFGAQSDSSSASPAAESLSVVFVEFDFDVVTNDGTTGDAKPSLPPALPTSPQVADTPAAQHRARIRFKVPLALPPDPQSSREHAQRHREQDSKRQHLRTLMRPSWARP